VLLVAALAVSPLVGCTSVTPDEGEGEGEEEICPMLNITPQVLFGGELCIQGGKQTITVTFAVPHESVYVYVGGNLRANPVGVPGSAAEVVMYPNADKTIYTGEFVFAQEEEYGEDYIYISTCDTCWPCKYSYAVECNNV